MLPHCCHLPMPLLHCHHLPTSSLLIVVCWYFSWKCQGALDSALWPWTKSAARCEQWRLLTSLSAISPFINVCWKSTVGMKNPSVRGGYGYNGQTHGVRTGCGLSFWKLHACGIIYQKMPWYYVKKKSILYFILHTQNTPTLCSNTPPKIGWDVTVGVFTLLAPIHGVGTHKKDNPSG